MNQRLVEALIHRAHGKIVAQMPLAENPGAIAVRAKNFGQRRLARVHHRATEKSISDARAIVVAAGKQTGAGRRAYGRNIEILAADTLSRQPVEIWRPNDRISMNAQVTMPLVIRDNHDNIGPFIPDRKSTRLNS